MLRKPYSYGPYNTIKGEKQAIRITEGCVWNCPNCHEPTKIKIFEIPKIQRNNVLIFDMNLLGKPTALDILNQLGNVRVKNKRVRYELVCGVDYRFLTSEIVDALFQNKVDCYVGFDQKLHTGKVIRVAWDGKYSEQRKIKKAIDLLTGRYVSTDIMVFMLDNYSSVGFEEQCLKLDLCKIWNVRVCDCYFDGQTGRHIEPLFWSAQEIRTFRHKVRKHNQLINFRIDPELKEAN